MTLPNGNVVAVAAANVERTLRSLTAIVAIQWMGATLGLPLLPLYLKERGGTPTEIGVVISSFFVAGLLTQFYAGHLSDRFGRRIVLVAGLVGFGAASVMFVLPLHAAWYIVARSVQGAGAGAIEVASLATVAALVPEVRRGRAISRIYAAQLGGIAVGPLIGALIPLSRLGWAYVAAAVLSSVAALVAFRSNLGDDVTHTEPMEKVRRTDQFYGALFGGVAVGLCIGVYETCWSLLLNNHHATTLQIRLSWTLFATPFVLLSPLGGRLADRANRRVIGQLGMFNAAFFLALYPHIHNNWVLLFIGPLESVGAALSIPSISSLLTQGAASRETGRRQGLYTTANTGALAVSAIVAGALFSVQPELPFTVIAIVSALITSTNFWWWRNVRGHISE